MLTTLSADSLKTWDTCVQQFEWKVLNHLHWPSDTRNFALGTRIHKLMDYQSRGMDVTPLLTQADAAVQATWALLQQHPAVQWPCVASEWGFEFPVETPDHPPVWMTGRIDRVAWHQNQLWIIDWKTGTAAPRAPEKAWQTGMYALAVWQAWRSLPPGPWQKSPPQAVNVTYVAVSPPEVRQLTVRLGPEEIAYWQTRLQTSLHAIMHSTSYQPQAPCPDKWCVYQPMCPVTKTVRIN
jgi:hypothetical protein